MAQDSKTLKEEELEIANGDSVKAKMLIIHQVSLGDHRVYNVESYVCWRGGRQVPAQRLKGS